MALWEIKYFGKMFRRHQMYSTKSRFDEIIQIRTAVCLKKDIVVPYGFSA